MRLDDPIRMVRPAGTRIRRGVVACLLVCVNATAVFGDEPADRFVAQIAGDSKVPAAAGELIRTTWQNCSDCNGSEFLIQGLTLFSAGFRDALDAYDGDRYEECVQRMGALRTAEDRFVAVNAAVFEIKALVALDRMTDATERIEQLLTDGGDDLLAHSYFSAEVEFLRGFCLLADLHYDRAGTALRQFLRAHPDAPQRLQVSAEQMLAELANRQPGRIGEVVDLMDYSGRHLRTGDSGAPVQQKQGRVIEILSLLIEEAEQQEQSGGGGGSSGGSGSNPQTPQTPLQESRLQGGRGAEAELREARRANPAETWGSMPPAEREKILQALKDSFPSRYRRLVEQYYEELAKKP